MGSGYVTCRRAYEMRDPGEAISGNHGLSMVWAWPIRLEELPLSLPHSYAGSSLLSVPQTCKHTLPQGTCTCCFSVSTWLLLPLLKFSASVSPP